MKLDIDRMDRIEAHHLMTDIVVPRPIAWVSTVDENGIFNLAPFSAFSLVNTKPPIIGFSVTARRDGKPKDTPTNIDAVKDFVIAIVNEELMPAMNITANVYPHEVSEFIEAGLTPIKGDVVKSAIVSEAPVNMECKLVQKMVFGEPPLQGIFFMGEVVRVHVRDDLYLNGEIQVMKLDAIGRLGGDYYCRTRDVFKMERPNFDPQ